MYIVVEGMNSAGKSYAVGKLKAIFESKGKEVVTVREPGGIYGQTSIEESIRSVLLNKDGEMTADVEFALFTAARQSLYNTIIKKSLADGKIVISDRSFVSTLVYQVELGNKFNGDEIRVTKDIVIDTMRTLLKRGWWAGASHTLVIFPENLDIISKRRSKSEDIDRFERYSIRNEYEAYINIDYESIPDLIGKVYKMSAVEGKEQDNKIKELVNRWLEME